MGVSKGAKQWWAGATRNEQCALIVLAAFCAAVLLLWAGVTIGAAIAKLL